MSERIALFVIEKGQYWCSFLRFLYNFLTKSVRGFCGGNPESQIQTFYCGYHPVLFLTAEKSMRYVPRVMESLRIIASAISFIERRRC